jgi:hypothetical protein
MELSFDDAAVVAGEGFTSKYMAVGNHKVVITEVTKGLSSAKQSPFVQITVENEAKETCSQQYYLNGGAWNISKDNILTIVSAALGVDEVTAKSSLTGLTGENVDAKLATLLVGKRIGINLSGEWINPTDTTKKSFVKSVFGKSGRGFLFAVPLNKFETLNPTPYIKGSDMSVKTPVAHTQKGISEPVSDELPW